MKLKLLILSILTSLSLLGQDKAGKVFVSVNPKEEGVSVRWIGPEISYQEGINIYRKQKGGKWNLLAVSPIMPPDSLNKVAYLNENSKGIYDVFLLENHQDYIDGFMGIISIIESIKDYDLALAMKIAYNDKTAELGKKYSYKVEAILKGKTIEIGTTGYLKYEGFQPIALPLGIEITRKKKKTYLKWVNDEANYYAYNVYFKNAIDKEYTLVEKELGSAVIGSKVEKMVTFITHKDSVYSVKIEAFDYFGGKSELSEEMVIEIEDFDAPKAPKLTVTADSKTMLTMISWEAGSETDISHYNLYRLTSTKGDSIHQLINNQPISKDATTFEDQLPEPGVYSYKLGVVDNAGNESKTVVYLADVKDISPPPIPLALKVKVDTGKFILSWAIVQADDFDGYEILRSLSDDNNGDNKYLPVSGLLDTNYFEIEMSENVRSPFVYVVRSVDLLINRSQFSEPVIAQLPDVVAPIKPFISNVQEGEGMLYIKWQKNVETDLKGYNLYRKNTNDTLCFQKVNGIMIPKSLTGINDKYIQKGVKYTYYLEAVDQTNLISVPSNYAKGMLPFSELSGAIVIEKQKFNKNKKEINLMWSADSLFNEPISGFSVYRSHNGGKSLKRTKMIKAMMFKEKLNNPGKYSYHIRAYGSRGNILKSREIVITVVEEKKN